MIRISAPLAIGFLGLLAVLPQAATAVAGEPAKPSKGSLTGVDGGYRIVQPAAPQPEPDDTSNGANRQFKIGDMDVRISGSVIVDVGAGAVSAPRR